MTVALALQGAWLMIPEDLRQSVGANVQTALTAVLLLCGIAGRLVSQQPTNGEKDQ